jgi:hypothetical protein
VRDALNSLGEEADRLDSLVAGLELPLPPQFHLEQLKEILPDISKQIKLFVIQEAGENPWGSA